MNDELLRLAEALTPSAETKAAYIGEFRFPYTRTLDSCAGETTVMLDVPWTTIKEIMAAIRERASLRSRAHPLKGE